MALYLTPADHERVSAAVHAAEQHTAGEVVTVVADRSDGYNDVVLGWSAAVALLALCVIATVPDFYLGIVDRLLGHWGHRWVPGEVLALAAFVAFAKFAGMWLLQLWAPLRYFLIPPAIKTDRTHRRALGLFKVGAERRTAGRTGILIYLSMQEHRAHIVADEAIASKVDPAVWGEAMIAMLAELKQGRLADGMIAAVDRVGVVLAEHLPRTADDTNELPDRLIEL